MGNNKYSYISYKLFIQSNDTLEPVVEDTDANTETPDNNLYETTTYTINESMSTMSSATSHKRDIISYCSALFDYEANSDDELTIHKNDYIAIVDKCPNDVDDGWWLGFVVDGDYDAQVYKQFPSMLVQEEC
jgi:hypothetical protein